MLENSDFKNTVKSVTLYVKVHNRNDGVLEFLSIEILFWVWYNYSATVITVKT